MTATVEGVDQFLASLRARHAPMSTIKAYTHDLRHFWPQFLNSFLR